MTETTTKPVPGGNTVLVEFENGIAWVTMNRPEKRNAVSPTLAAEMLQVMNALEIDPRCKVWCSPAPANSFCAGMDLKEFFRETDNMSPPEREQIIRANAQWQWRQLMFYPKPTIAMVNGWCFGGAFTPLVSCDLAIAAEEATFGLSEINWGIIPAGVVTKAVAQVMSQRDALYYIMTGETFDGRKAAAMKLVNEAVRRSELRARTKQLAETLMGKNPTVLRAAKTAYRRVRDMSYEDAGDYLMAKNDQARLFDPEQGREQGMKQFLDDKSYRPGLKVTGARAESASSAEMTAARSPDAAAHGRDRGRDARARHDRRRRARQSRALQLSRATFIWSAAGPRRSTGGPAWPRSMTCRTASMRPCWWCRSRRWLTLWRLAAAAASAALSCSRRDLPRSATRAAPSRSAWCRLRAPATCESSARTASASPTSPMAWR